VFYVISSLALCTHICVMHTGVCAYIRTCICVYILTYVGPDGISGEILKLGGKAMIPYLARHDMT
jgi:hypothetical protein